MGRAIFLKEFRGDLSGREDVGPKNGGAKGDAWPKHGETKGDAWPKNGGAKGDAWPKNGGAQAKEDTGGGVWKALFPDEEQSEHSGSNAKVAIGVGHSLDGDERGALLQLADLLAARFGRRGDRALRSQHLVHQASVLVERRRRVPSGLGADRCARSADRVGGLLCEDHREEG